MTEEGTSPSARFRQLRLLQVPNPLEERLGKALFRSIPPLPGVYFFRDASGQLLYIGQSHDLKARIGSYKHVSQERHPRRMQRMVSRIASVEWQICEDAWSAVELEKRLLLEHRPPFNRAGVWQGEPWWIEIHVVGEDRLKVSMSRESRTEEAVAMYGGARYVHASLMRCLYRGWHPETSLNDFPVGLFNVRVPLELQVSCKDAASWKTWILSFLRGEESLLLRKLEELLPLYQEYWSEELEGLGKYFESRSRRRDV